MDPFVEKSPLFHELHTQFLAEAQRLLQPQLRPRYLARLERHLSEGSTWEGEAGMISLAGKEPDLTLTAANVKTAELGSTAVLDRPMAEAIEELDPDELELRKQRRIVIYVNAQPRLAVTSIELLSPSNKDAGSVGQTRYLEKRSSALHGGLNWVEIDLLRAGSRPPVYVELPGKVDYLVYVAQATPTGRRHRVYGWKLCAELPVQSIPLLGTDRVTLDLGACFQAAYDAIAADEEADYAQDPPPPPLSNDDAAWADELLKSRGLR
jgi:hypothetical protein